jgi:hypothetical protein
VNTTSGLAGMTKLPVADNHEISSSIKIYIKSGDLGERNPPKGVRHAQVYMIYRYTNLLRVTEKT